MARSDWSVYSAAAMKEGKTLKEASQAWRRANHDVFRNPHSPESRYHHHRRKAVGELLRRNVSFGEARRLVDKGFDGYQHATKRVERGIVHAGEKRNPSGDGTNWLLIGGIAAAAWWLLGRQQQPNPLTTQGPVTYQRPTGVTGGPTAPPPGYQWLNGQLAPMTAFFGSPGGPQ